MEASYPTEVSIGKILDPKNAVKSLNLSGSHYLGESALIENFLLLNTQSRKTSIFFIENENQYEESSRLARKLGLGLKVSIASKKYPSAKRRAFTFIDEEEVVEALEPILRATYANPDVDILDQFPPLIHERVGKLMDYDRCCVSAVLRDIQNLVNPDERISKQIKSYREKGREADPNSFYVAKFIPCKPDCRKASSKGIKFENDLRNQAGDAAADIYMHLKLEHLRDAKAI